MHNLSTFLLFFLFLSFIQNSFSNDQLILEQSKISTLASKSLLLQSNLTGSLTVVVGERGHILFSNDNKTWQQASVATRQTLTNVFMLDEMTGWAVGHDAIILKTTDGAKTWEKQFSDITEEAPLLDLFFKDSMNGIAVGAYSLVYVTADGGVHWSKTDLNISETNADQLSEYTGISDFHLNSIESAGEQRLYIAAEAGHILRSDDYGENWIDLASPYHGSFFGILPLSYNDVIAYGLRGSIYFSKDAGNSWEQINNPGKEMLTDATILENGDIIIVGLAGTLLLSKDRGSSFATIELNHRHSFSSVLEIKDDSLLLTGDAGIELISKGKLVINKN